MVRDVVVVGNGPFGSAATKYLAAAGLDVVCVGARPTRTVEHAATVFSSHHDAARLVRYHSRHPGWVEASRRALDLFPEIERESGVSFYEPVGCLMSAAPDGDGFDLTGVDHAFFDVGDRSWRARWPELAFPDTHWVAFEPAPAGYVRPLDMVRAQNAIAVARGAEIVDDTVVDVRRSNGAFEVRSRSGRVDRAATVLAAAGGFTNLHDLLPQPVDLELKTEVIVLGEVSDDDAGRLAGVPTVTYEVHDDAIDGIYMTPPARYPDGRHYIKLGADTMFDTRFRPGEVDLAWMQSWFTTDTDPQYLPIFGHHLEALWPDVDFVSLHTRPCLITYTDDGMPAIEQVDEGLFVATGGNGTGAKSADSWGHRAATLLTDTRSSQV